MLTLLVMADWSAEAVTVTETLAEWDRAWVKVEELEDWRLGEGLKEGLLRPLAEGLAELHTEALAEGDGRGVLDRVRVDVAVRVEDWE